MLRQALLLWRNEKQHKGTTLQKRLVLFFISATMFVIFAFVMLLLLFGITGKGEDAARLYLSNELSHLSETVSDDFGQISLLGIELSGWVSTSCDSFFKENGIEAGQLSQHPELLEPLLGEQMQLLMSTLNHNLCSGVFVLLDAMVKPEAESAETARSGLFIKITQPMSVPSVSGKSYCLRGPAQVARDNGIELLGQWKMEYDITDEDFWNVIMQTARENSELALSRLYYWTGRVTLHGNSEASFLLCVPLRSEDGTVFGVCGVEVSDRLFKKLYSPKESNYENVFAVAAPCDGATFKTSQGLVAGNYYLTGNRMTEDLTLEEEKSSFCRFFGETGRYGGLTDAVKLYPDGSPYAQQQWSVAVMMPESLLNDAVSGDSAYLMLIVVVLLICSLSVSVVVSQRYLKPVTKALSSIRNNTYDTSTPYLEINDLFVFLADKDDEHGEELRRLDEERRGAEIKFDEVSLRLKYLSDKKREEIDRESYELFKNKLRTLTPKEREVFGLYLDGKKAKEIVELLAFTENALKYHNKNIYSKLGVSSRNELLRYAALMKQDEDGK